MSVRRSFAVLAAATALVTASCLLGGSLSAAASRLDSAQADQPFVTPIGTDAPAAQQHIAAQYDEMGDTVGEVLSLVADTVYSLGQNLGFAGQVLDVPNLAITVYWKGDLPDLVATYLNTTAALLGVEVHIVNGASFTRDEAQAAAAGVGASDVAQAAGVTSISVNADGSGLTVQMADGEPTAAVKDQIAQAAGINAADISYEIGVGQLVDKAGSRTNDVAPWKGGGRIRQGSHGCTTGFDVLDGTAGRIVTAAHCDPEQTHVVQDGVGDAIAPASGTAFKTNIDSESIDPTVSPATIARIFTGAWNSSTVATVKNWASNWKGDTVCMGGATTGAHCGTITDDAVTVPGLEGSWYIRARYTPGTWAGNGDSGGSMYRNITGGVQARGIFKASYTATTTPCAASVNPDVVDPVCSTDIVYVPISVVLNKWGYKLEVG